MWGLRIPRSSGSDFQELPLQPKAGISRARRRPLCTRGWSMDWCPATGTRMKSLFHCCVCCFFTLALTRSAGLGCLAWMSFKVPSPQTLLGFQERSGAGAGAVTAPGNLGAPNYSGVPNPAAKTSAQPVPKPCFPSPSLLPASPRSRFPEGGTAGVCREPGTNPAGVGGSRQPAGAAEGSAQTPSCYLPEAEPLCHGKMRVMGPGEEIGVFSGCSGLLSFRLRAASPS